MKVILFEKYFVRRQLNKKKINKNKQKRINVSENKELSFFKTNVSDQNVFVCRFFVSYSSFKHSNCLCVVFKVLFGNH